MTPIEWAVSIAAVMVPWILIYFFVSLSNKSDFKRGCQAYYDGIPFNEGWPKSMKKGWRKAAGWDF